MCICVTVWGYVFERWERNYAFNYDLLHYKRSHIHCCIIYGYVCGTQEIYGNEACKVHVLVNEKSAKIWRKRNKRQKCMPQRNANDWNSTPSQARWGAHIN